MRTLSAAVTRRNKLASKDKRSKTDLEFFVLALVEHDVNTPYVLHTVAALSVGATLPVLDRLTKAGYVRRGPPGERRRTEYEITASGIRHLKSGWRPLFEARVPAGIEAVLRIATLAILSGADKKAVVGYLKRAAASKTADSKRRKDDPIAAEPLNSAGSNAKLYRRMLAIHASERLATEAKVLRRFATSIARRSLPSL